MAYGLTLLVPLLVFAGFVLGAWLKKHPGHPILQEIDDYMLSEAKTLALRKAAVVLAAKGITLPGETATAAVVTTTTSPPAPAGK